MSKNGSKGVISEPMKETPVVADVDVAVAGGGTGSVVAAIALARAGATTMREFLHQLTSTNPTENPDTGRNSRNTMCPIDLL
jgi:alkyl hydroperoxide reductase subunit AhpF